MKKTNKSSLIAIAIITVWVAFMVTQCSKIGNLKEEVDVFCPKIPLA